MWLVLILSLFFYCCGCPRYWGRQQVAWVSNTQSQRLSGQWIDAAKAAHFHASLNTLRQGLFRSPSSSGARIVILVLEFMHEEESATCPNHLKCLVRRAAVTSCTPNIAKSVSPDTSSSSLTPQSEQTIDLSFWRSCCRSGAVGAQVPLPCNRAERTQALKTLPQALRDACSDVRIGRSLLNFPQTVLHLVTMASLHPLPAHSLCPR